MGPWRTHFTHGREEPPSLGRYFLCSFRLQCRRRLQIPDIDVIHDGHDHINAVDVRQDRCHDGDRGVGCLMLYDADHARQHMRAGQSDRNEIDDDRPENESDTPDAGKSAERTEEEVDYICGYVHQLDYHVELGEFLGRNMTFCIRYKIRDQHSEADRVDQEHYYLANESILSAKTVRVPHDEQLGNDDAHVIVGIQDQEMIEDPVCLRMLLYNKIREESRCDRKQDHEDYKACQIRIIHFVINPCPLSPRYRHIQAWHA